MAHCRRVPFAGISAEVLCLGRCRACASNRSYLLRGSVHTPMALSKAFAVGWWFRFAFPLRRAACS